jgi:S-adenosylmethionine:tRNA ribosyltransferase-isomerase
VVSGQETRVIGTDTGQPPVEVLLLRDLGGDVWECLTRPGKKTKTSTALMFGDGEMTATITGITESGTRLIKFVYNGEFPEILERLGQMPTPPYIREKLNDAERYQTVYSSINGSAAAPTAGLHFTRELLDEISARGIHLCYLTLHVGLGTFRPVKTDRIQDHRMHAEYYSIPHETAETLNRAKSDGGRIIAVGTTSCRTLESCADDSGTVRASSGFTDIFIYPGYKFKCIGGLITNFHLPESTLLMLVSAFAGRENVLNAYNERRYLSP